MNIHHLELVYYVARHGGISEAVRNMPYGALWQGKLTPVTQDFLGEFQERARLLSA